MNPKKSFNVLRITPAEQVKLDYLRYRYPMRSAVTLDAELRQIETCVKRGFPRIALHPIRDDTLCIVGYGPSLRDTWKEITKPCLTVSGAHDFLIACGIVPDYHVECDGRDHKTRHLEHPHKGCTYLMASICNPKMWDQLAGHSVKYWHNTNGQHVVDWIGKNDDGSVLIAGGSVVGLSAIHVAGIYGFRRFRLFGFDGNFDGDVRHAGPHFGPPQRIITRDGWKTTPQMSNACDELLHLMADTSIQIEVVGRSLMKTLTENRAASWR